jgi:hypothetical protein
MATKKKMLQAAAGSATGGAGLDITDVFSTYLYTGTNDDGPNFAQTITNGIDLAGEGGLVWTKARDYSANHALVDTVRGNTKYLESDTSDGESTTSVGITAFNSDGYDLGADNTWKFNVNNAYVSEYASWTFRKAPKFFDVVTYAGDSNSSRVISHNLGSAVGMIIIKTLNSNDSWNVFHRGLDNGLGTGRLFLNNTNSVDNNTLQFLSADSSSVTFANNAAGNYSGNDYVMYLFAHNDGDGEFGPDADQDIIKCGSYTGNGDYLDGKYVDVGFEPQWILQKAASTTGPWLLLDTMRGWDVNTGNKPRLLANASNYEANSNSSFALTGDSGFTIYDTSNSINGNGQNYIYMAIRRGPLAPPESATEVFAIDASPNSSFPVYESGFPVDLGIRRYDYPSSGNSYFVGDRLRGANRLITNLTNAEASTTDVAFDSQDGWWTQPENSTSISWMWKRAPGYFDVVAYTGNGVRGRTVSHNLGVVPEMMWIKNRDDPQNWLVYIHSLGGTKKLYLNTASPAATASIDDFNNTDAEATQFTLGNDGRCNANNQDFIAYLFASLPGISKVGSYTGNGSSQTIDCGFTSGARFVLVKDTTGGNWFVYDSARGITSGSDPALRLNLTSAEVSTADAIAPNSSGFIVQASYFNNSGDTYIFYAVA